MKLRKYQEKDFNKMVLLLQTCFNNNYFNPKIVKWKYFATPLNKPPICYVAEDNNKIVSTYISLPISIVVKDKKLKSTVCTDMCTHQKYRGQGLISKLAKLTYSNIKVLNYQYTIGFSNKSGIKVDQNSKGYGYKIIGSFLKVIMLPQPILRSNRIIKTTNFDKKFIRQIKSQYYSINVDTNYLNWRYLNKPNNKYQILEVSDKNNHKTGYAVVEIGRYKMYLVDVICDTKTPVQTKTIVKCVQNYAFKKLKPLVVIYALDNKFLKKATSYFSLRYKPKKHPYYLTIKPHTKMAADNKQILSKENWVLFSGSII